jgi:hypothetical protein
MHTQKNMHLMENTYCLRGKNEFDYLQDNVVTILKCDYTFLKAITFIGSCPFANIEQRYIILSNF